MSKANVVDGVWTIDLPEYEEFVAVTVAELQKVFGYDDGQEHLGEEWVEDFVGESLDECGPEFYNDAQLVEGRFTDQFVSRAIGYMQDWFMDRVINYRKSATGYKNGGKQ